MTADQRPGAGDVAIVTGASSGIGAALTRMLVEAGVTTVATARRLAALEALASELGPKCIPVQLDVTDAVSCETILSRIPAQAQAITILVNNAGSDVHGFTRFDQGKLDDWLATLDTNILGMFRVCHAVVPRMLETGGGHIINIGSIRGRSAYAGGTAYCASKYGVNGFSEALRLDYNNAIRVTEIQPGVVKTSFDSARRDGDEEAVRKFFERFPEVLYPEDIANAAMYALRQPKNVTIAEMLILPSAS